jgi:flagellar hook-associated protein 1 FlgK
VTYKYCSHEYNRDTGRIAIPRQLTLVLGVRHYNHTGDRVADNRCDRLNASKAGNLRKGDKAVLNLTAANTAGAYQQVDIAFDYNDNEAVDADDPGQRCHRFVFAGQTAGPPLTPGVLDGQSGFALRFFTLNDNAISQYYGQDYNGSISLDVSSAPPGLGGVSPAAYLSYYNPDTTETFMVQHVTTDDFWRGVAAETGVLSQEAQRMVKNQDTVLNQLGNKKESVSGVSTDEELTNMIKIPAWLQRNRPVHQHIDEQIDIIVNRMGLVGR